MSAPRGNGLSADRYVRLGEVDPRQTQSLLDALRELGIAAYAEPTAPRVGPYLDVRVPRQQTDRLHVDAARLSDARALLDDAVEPPATPGAAAPSAEADDPWEQIVAGFDAPSAPVGAWPALEDLDVSHPQPAAREALTPEPVPDEDERYEDPDEGHFVPPPPPPIPVAHPLTFWAWVALLGGIAVLLGAALIGYELSSGWSLVAILLVVGGFVTLVARMRDSPPTDSGPDDGAVV